jgi:DUF4097 and DUF4098 domain-containing protein YvlB
MSHTQISHGLNKYLLAGALAVLGGPWSLVHAAAVEERRPANPQGAVEIINVAGSVDVQGWDRPEVEVSGTVGKDVERVELTGDANRTTVRVVLPSQLHTSNNDGAAKLVVHVPTGSSLTTSLVSSDLKVSAVRGDMKLQTVSGNISGEGGGDLRANSVSGNVTLTAPAAKSIEVKTISGDIVLGGGDADTAVTTISGDAQVNLGSVARARLKTISGTLSAHLGARPDAQIEGESVSGNIKLDFLSAPAADFEIETLSGSIDNCFGPKPAATHSHGPGVRLAFKTGDTRGTVKISTKSGDVHMCTKGA